jgi:hypothetical protein
MRKVFICLVALVCWLAAAPVRAGVAVIEATVDGSDFLLVRAAEVRVEHRNFEPLTDLKVRFDPAEGLPVAAVTVTVTRLEGTGPVTVVEQPAAGNDYTLKVLVDNDNESLYPQKYRLRLEWEDQPATLFPTMDRRIHDYFHWRGDVDGTDILRFRGAGVTIEHVRAQPIRNQRVDFTAPLPAARLDVAVYAVRARGAVEIIQQPSAANDYTAIIRIDDGRFSGSDVYDLYLYWPKELPAVAVTPDEMDFYWEGRVDGVDRVVVRGRNAALEHLQSRPPEGVNSRFRRTLPRVDQTVALHVFEGRGSVKLQEQPSRWNEYAVILLVDDSGKSGAATYRFGLRWEKGESSTSPDLAGTPPAGTGGVIRWRGQVDGKDRLLIRGDTVTIQHITAQPIRNASQTFSNPLPARDVTVTLNPLVGRGTVRIVEQPSRGNSYTLVVEIEDPAGGAGVYEFELIW